MSRKLLITFASWEDRFRLGFERDLAATGADRAVVFAFKSYESWTDANRRLVEALCETNDVAYDLKWLDVAQPVANWRTVKEVMDHSGRECSEVLLDVSTMPREVIWYVMWHLEQVEVNFRYVYHSPERYGDDWLSRSPQAPRLVFKLSGVSRVSARTALLVLVGFDIQRVKRLVGWFEPAKLVVGCQSSSNFARNDRTMEEWRQQLIGEYEKECDCEAFELDSYADDCGLSAIQEKLEELDQKFNVIMGSLGPKLTAISLFKLQRARDERGLVYAPASQFSWDYSAGIGKQYGSIL